MCEHVGRGTDKHGRVSSAYGFFSARRESTWYSDRPTDYDSAAGKPRLLPCGPEDSRKRGFRILKYEYERDSGNTSENEFTSDGAEDDENEEEDSIEDLVLMLNERQKNSQTKDEDQLIEENLSHLNEVDFEAVQKIIRDYPEVIANLFEDVGP